MIRIDFAFVLGRLFNVYQSIRVETLLIVTDGNPAAVLGDIGCEEKELKEKKEIMHIR